MRGGNEDGEDSEHAVVRGGNVDGEDSEDEETEDDVSRPQAAPSPSLKRSGTAAAAKKGRKKGKKRTQVRGGEKKKRRKRRQAASSQGAAAAGNAPKKAKKGKARPRSGKKSRSDAARLRVSLSTRKVVVFQCMEHILWPPAQVSWSET